MLRDFSLSLTFVAALLIAYTALVLYSKKTTDATTRTQAAAMKSAVEAPPPAEPTSATATR